MSSLSRSNARGLRAHPSRPAEMIVPRSRSGREAVTAKTGTRLLRTLEVLWSDSGKGDSCSSFLMFWVASCWNYHEVGEEIVNERQEKKRTSPPMIGICKSMRMISKLRSSLNLRTAAPPCSTTTTSWPSFLSRCWMIIRFTIYSFSFG